MTRQTAPVRAERMLRVPEVAALLGVHRDTVYQWMETRGLPFRVQGSQRRVPESWLAAWQDALPGAPP